jgi:CBS domain-containing protein
MTSPAITVTRSTPIPLAAAKMEKHHIHRLVVVADDDEHLPIGILSTTDLVHAIVEASEATAVAVTPDGAAAEPAAEEAPDAR